MASRTHLVLALVFIHFAAWGAQRFLLEAAGQFRNGEPGHSAVQRLLQRVVHELVLLLSFQ